jgi:hypothetical protein
MMRVNNEHHIPAQQNTDFRSFSQLSGLLPNQALIKGHLNTCLNTSGSKHNSLEWLEYLKMLRTWNFSYMPVIQRRNLVQFERFLRTFLKVLETPKVLLYSLWGISRRVFNDFLGFLGSVLNILDKTFVRLTFFRLVIG